MHLTKIYYIADSIAIKNPFDLSEIRANVARGKFVL
jgi:hypothetical protein